MRMAFFPGLTILTDEKSEILGCDVDFSRGEQLTCFEMGVCFVMKGS